VLPTKAEQQPQILTGDMKAVTRHELLRAAMAHAPELKRFLKRQVSDATDAQDLMQEVYLAVLKVPRSQTIRQPKAYLFSVASNLAHHHWQRRKGYPLHVRLDEVPAEFFQGAHPAFEVNPSESVAALAERLSHLGERLSELSPNVQAAVVWHHRDGYTCDEIAEKLSVVRHRVKKYLVRGLSHCRTNSP
jgi:RNA polymerase sigma factor (sigma-70 family)